MHIGLTSLFVAVLLATTAAAGPFMRGISGCSADAQGTKLLRGLGATHVRRYLMWHDAQHTLSELDHGLTIAMMKAHPQKHIYDWADRALDFRGIDRQMAETFAAGLIPVAELTEGTVYGLPRYNGTLADPGVIGMDMYLVYQYRWVRALLHHLEGRNLTTEQQRPGVMSTYQIENELNEAMLSSLIGQRLMTRPWGNWTFLTELLSTLRDAVKAEQPRARVTMNFHTDVPRELHALLKLPGYYLDAVADWRNLTDVVSIDAYPNMVVAQPSHAAVVGDRVAAVQKVLRASPGVSSTVFVMETGYPVLAASKGHGVPTFKNGTALPMELRFSQDTQAQYCRDVVAAVHAAGGCGLFYFDMTPSPGMGPPPATKTQPAGYTAADERLFIEIAKLMSSPAPNATQALEWLAAPGNLAEVIERGEFFMTRADHEHGWGLVDAASKPKLGYGALRKAFRDV
jgi:hypothetical protein